MPGGVTVEVVVELGDVALQHAPHRLAKIRHEFHHPQRGDRGRARLTEVGGEQVLVFRRPNSWLTERLARSKKRSPIPAYSQSTILISPSSRKLALSRSLWHGAGGCAPRTRWMRSDVACATAYAEGISTPCAWASRRYSSTTACAS